jgi:hypothetical protein
MFKDHHDRSDPTAVAYPTATLPECQAVQQVLLDEMDWVGTTESCRKRRYRCSRYVVVEQQRL